MYIAARWMNITMQKYVTEIIMTKKALWEWAVTKGGFIFSSNCRLVKLRAAYQVLQNHKFTSPSSGRSCNLTRVKLSGDIFPFLDWNCAWRPRVLILSATKPPKALANGIRKKCSFDWSEERPQIWWLCWLFVFAKPTETELAGGRCLRLTGQQLCGRTRPHTHSSICDIWLKKNKTKKHLRHTVCHKSEYTPHKTANI